ncbi:MAG: PilZ domain-containing protein [Sedimenticola sp.]|uniref:PilZ domain-containing protein n=1 Tax=Sedimenticola thiotaurini TaxID=1543721 RepID=A0A558D0K1_9GAMM|nr:PilZ domain-containing protein [Sedimenticola sp.]TVT54549.1 MAG: PilZ domain-containing protein [Sedimenticola thiotaurini]MCW8881793.1 PilZ domain-containing protein [Sedimenticola sp.]MCW8920988.1 PilZ domain-containing protein [Sedimenticola sp.]MCW8947734.1 PilZ domain-containing protein [Sedimenticola sp.]
MAPSADNRVHPRFSLRSHVKLTDAQGNVREVYTRDLSHGGLYLLVMDAPLPAVNDEVEVQALDIEDPLPQRAVVVRVESGTGVAIKFL